MGKQSKAQREWYERNRELAKTRTKERNRIRKESARAYINSLNLECDWCGEDHPGVLDFHHTDPTQKEFNVADGLRSGFSLERLITEIGKCQVLCANCHRKLHYEERNM